MKTDRVQDFLGKSFPFLLPRVTFINHIKQELHNKNTSRVSIPAAQNIPPLAMTFRTWEVYMMYEMVTIAVRLFKKYQQVYGKTNFILGRSKVSRDNRCRRNLLPLDLNPFDNFVCNISLFDLIIKIY